MRKQSSSSSCNVAVARSYSRQRLYSQSREVSRDSDDQRPGSKTFIGARPSEKEVR